MWEVVLRERDLRWFNLPNQTTSIDDQRETRERTYQRERIHSVELIAVDSMLSADQREDALSQNGETELNIYLGANDHPLPNVETAKGTYVIDQEKGRIYLRNDSGTEDVIDLEEFVGQ